MTSDPQRMNLLQDLPPLTIDRLFDAPALAGPGLLSLKLSPDGSRIVFLRSKETDKDCLDLWEFDLRSGVSRLLVDSSSLPSRGDRLSVEEQARRERQRTAALRGIVEYSFAPAGNAILFPLDGTLYYCRFGADAGSHDIQGINTLGSVTDATVSPDGSIIAAVSNQNILIHHVQTGQMRALTRDGTGPVKNGMAEFVAQEEMDRDTGYWWAPDSQHIAFARVDESMVTQAQRFEVTGDEIRVFDQRYPEAGGRNARVDIGVVNVHTEKVSWLDLDEGHDCYIARVDWLPDGSTLAIQCQSRDQKRLDLVFADISTGQTRVVLTETSESWIDLHHELTFLDRSPQFIWASSRSGHTHLYLFGMDGALVRPLTSGAWSVDNFRARAIRGLDESTRTLFFMATAKSPTERHLYRTSLDNDGLVQISREPGIHAVSMSSSTGDYVDQFNSATQPPRVGFYDREGQLKLWLMENALDQSHPSAPFLATNATIELGELKSSDGQTLHYRLYKPSDFDNTRQYPAIIEVYGGPGVQRVLNAWPGGSFSQILTRAGFIVMMLDNRGSAHRGTAFQSPIRGQLGEVEVADQLTGARWLGSQDYIDASRLGVWGWSYGGYLTLMLMFKAPEIFKAGVSGAPVTDWRLYDTHYTERYLGRPQENQAGYESSSVLTYAARSTRALMLMHGMADDNVLFSHSTKLISRLQQLQKPFDVMVYPGAKHGLLRQQDGRHAYATILHFFQLHLA